MIRRALDNKSSSSSRKIMQHSPARPAPPRDDQVRNNCFYGIHPSWVTLRPERTQKTEVNLQLHFAALLIIFNGLLNKKCLI